MKLIAKYVELNLRRVSLWTRSLTDRGTQDEAACAAVADLYNGFWGPWAMLDTWPEARARGWRATPAMSQSQLV